MKVSIEEALQRGISAHRDGKLQEAEKFYRSILQAYPKHPDANHNLGLLAVSVGKSADALPFLKAALEANPKIEQFWLSYIDTLLKENHFATASQILENSKASGIYNENFRLFSERIKNTPQETTPSQGELEKLSKYYQSSQYEEAEDLAISITKKFPNHALAWKILATVLKRKGDLLRALEAGERVTALTPKDAEAHFNVGNTLQDLNRLESSITSYKKAIELNLDFTEAHNNLGNVYRKTGQLSAAKESYEKVIELKPDNADAYNNLGITLKELGTLNEAQLNYRKSLKIKPNNAAVVHNLADTCRHLGKLSLAEKYYYRAISLRVNFQEAISGLGLILLKKGKHQEALLYLRAGTGSISFDVATGVSIK